ncbi:opioid-binding protein/cell adhesion molecule-like [Leptidea sinapis]|uniref:opioid-binding protein/cell adhesion molecule-like n=1 Tax=Leptidea sinapis TaxID=189913 RepID=UPI0021419C02|nr:opioid-binding protein/cell adhesion molecule-like [Leptidea sinapis]XP_050679319.1 opioid-binding protein/cell adhesion molecule-like [Leptidea sinapis]
MRRSRKKFYSPDKMVLRLFAALILWRIDCLVECTKVVKSNMRYQTTSPLSRVGPTAAVRDAEPNFDGPIENVTVALGREAILTCSVSDIGDYKVAWIRADDQTILTLHTRLVTHSPRYAVTNDSPGSWQLHIRPLKVEDRGCYMCQINTSTMKKQIGCVDVLVPPNIVDEGTSGDLVAREGTDVSVRCKADGRPLPRILWRREDGSSILVRNPAGELQKADMFTGSHLNLTKVERTQMGAYLCIASNDVPPSVSKRIMLSVNFAPSISIPSKVIGVPTGSQAKLECLVESYPRAISYWLKSGEEMILSGGRYEINEIRISSYQTSSTLLISDYKIEDTGTYTCVCTNIIGKSEGIIRLYEIKITTTSTTTTTTTTTTSTTTTPPPTTTEMTTSPQYIVALQPAEQKFYTSDVTTYDTMQNVIEQSVLDNHWLPTVESRGTCAVHSSLLLFLPTFFNILIHLYDSLMIVNYKNSINGLR